MKLSIGKTKIQTKHLYVGIFVALFFIVQFATVFYAKATIRNAVANKDASSFTNAQLEQINTRLLSLEQRLNYIQSYIIANRNTN